MVNSGYQRDDLAIIDYQLWELEGQRLRGPAPDPDQPYFSALGAAQVFGRFVPKPFPALVSEAVGLPTLNLGLSGAGPSFYLRRPGLIEAANRGRFAIVQLMSGRSVSSRWIATGENQGVGRLRDQPDRPLRFAEDLYRDLLAGLSPGALATLRAELRDRYVTETALLLERIRVPKILLYWSQRPVDYEEGIGDLAAYWGDFPHFVNREVVNALRPFADDYVEVVTGRGIPQPLFDKAGQPVMMWPEDRFPHVTMREHNHYYPSPEMNRDAADALFPAAAKLAEAPALPATPPEVAAPLRHVLVHLHIFSNAGAVVDRSLKDAFRDRWAMFDPAPPEPAFSAEGVAGELRRRLELKAISSRQLRFPLGGQEGLCLHPIVLLRDPILRARSIYDYERMPARRDFSNALHTRQANALGFAGWIGWCLEGPQQAGPIANYQTRMCCLVRNGRHPGDWDTLVDIGQYREAADQLTNSHVGKVETIERSLFRIESALQPVFPELQLLPHLAEAGVEDGIAARPSHEEIEAELGRALYLRLCEANAWDLLLLERF